jgi:hypothetical protein
VTVYWRGRTWSDKGKRDRAIADFETAYGSARTIRAPRTAAASSTTCENDLDRAIWPNFACHQALPESELNLFNRGAALIDKHAPVRAISDFDAVQKHTPENAKALY